MNRVYMSRTAVLVAIVSLLASSCGEEFDFNGGKSQEEHLVTLNAGVGEKDDDSDENDIKTRAIFMNDNGKAVFYWQSSDSVGVAINGSESLAPLALESEYAGKQSGVFSGKVKGEVGSYAVYPYNKNHKISGNKLTYHLPSSYNCQSQSTVVYDWLSSEDDISVYNISANPSLYAQISDSEVSSSAQFKMLGGMFCVKLDYTPSSEFTLSVISDRKISGDFDVDLSAEQPKMTAASESVKDTVTFNMSIPTGNHSFVVYLPVPEGSYNFTVRMGCYNGSKIAETIYTSSTKSVTISRGEIKRVSLKESSMTKDSYLMIDGHKFVDLGLPSGILWADMNIGAESEADAGDYYSFGELETKEKYTQDSYKFWDSNTKSYSKYNKDKTTLDAEDDVVTQKWGSKFRMPTDTELGELSTNCEWTYTTRTNSAGKTVHGSQVKSNSTGASIFIPESGYKEGTSMKDSSYGYLLGSTILNTAPYNGAHIVYFFFLTGGGYSHAGGPNTNAFRYFGYPVRAIYKE